MVKYSSMVKISREVELGTGGRVVIPAEMREALELRQGDRLVITLEGGHLEITTRRALVQRLHGALSKDDGRDLTAELLADRRQEAQAKRW